MTLIDTSAWVEYLRGTGSPAHARVRMLLGEPGELVTTEPVMLELLAGTRTERERNDVRGTLAGCQAELVISPGDWEGAASIFRACRQRGVTPRKLLDCLIAAVAIRIDVPVLAHDRDFELIARHTPLRIAA